MLRGRPRDGRTLPARLATTPEDIVSQLPASRSQVLSDRYVLGEIIGHGGMAVVYRARDQVLERDVAVKLLRAPAPETGAGGIDAAARDRFTGEVRALAGLSHPGLVTLLDAGTNDGRPYLVMDLVEGTTLAARCDGTGLGAGRVAAIGAELAVALGYVHGRGIVHRDIKPGNVLLADDGRVRLGDFGIARLMEHTARLTGTGMTVGTAAYLAPEQVDERLTGGTVSPATDVYSLGLVLLEALTGTCPYPGPPATAALARLRTPPPIPEALPDRWRALLAWMTAVRPADRPTTDQVAATLASLVTDPGSGVGRPPRSTDPIPTIAQAGSGATTAPTVELAGLDVGRPAASRRDRRAGGVGRRVAAAMRMPAPARRGWSPRPRLLLLAVAVAVAAVLLVLAVALVRGGTRPGGSEVPNDLPPRIGEDLRDLHEAVNG
jgi:serine/threonine protein kinase